MKVRNLKQYIEILTQNKSTIPALGGEDDFLLKDYYGKKVTLDQFITDLPNFATDPRTQMFYELMQNAEDAESKSLHFFFDDHGILLLNNGLPFLTDSTPQRGQLFEFLFKGKGQKADDPNQIGEHGQGSKLLYTLILPNEYRGDKKEAVRKQLIGDLGGPILFSWQRESNITQLFSWSDQPFEYTGNCEDLYYPLLAKIVLTYYPAELEEVAMLFDGREAELFSKSEMASMVRFLNNIRSEVIWTDFSRGTLLYIPLGEGQGEKMASTWGDALKQGISVSMDFLKHLQYVYVNGEQIKRSGLHVVQLDNLTSGEKPVSLQLAMPVVGAQLSEKAINFYKFFPVARARYGLNYLINTKAYDVGAARQEIDLTDDNNWNVLVDVSAQIVEYIQQLRDNGHRDALMMLLRSVVQSLPNEDFFREYFHDNLLKAFASNLPVQAGFADTVTIVRIKKTALPVQPEDLGMVDWVWLDESLADLYDQIEDSLGISSCTITDLIKAAGENRELISWISSLPEPQYLHLLQEVYAEAKAKSPHWIKEIRCWRFSDGEVYTLEEIVQNDTLIFLLPEMSGLPGFLHKANAPLGGQNLEQLGELFNLIRKAYPTLTQLMWERITMQLSEIEIATRDDKWAIFRTYHADSTGQQFIGERLTIFLNTRREKKAPGVLSNQATDWAPSGILDSLSILASEVIPDMQPYFLQKKAVWPYLLENWQVVEEQLQADALAYPGKLRDLSNIYDSSPTGSDLLDDASPWILLPSGALAASGEVFCHEALGTFSPEQYNLLDEFISSRTSLCLAGRDLVNAVLQAPFAPVCQSGLKAIKAGLKDDEMNVDRELLEILLKVKTSGDGFFRFFTVKAGNAPNTFLLIKNDGSETQYFTKDKRLIEFLGQVDGYQLLPKELYNLFDTEGTLKNEPIDDGFVEDLINDFGADEAFIDIVLHRKNVTVQQAYLEKIKSINLWSDTGSDHYRDTFEFKSIKIITNSKAWIKEYKQKVFIDEVSIEKFEYTDDVKVGDLRPFSLSRLLPEEFSALSGKLAALKPKMTGSGFVELLENKPHNLSKIADKLFVAPDAYQLAFLIAHVYFDEQAEFRINTWERVEKESAIQEFYDRNMAFFSEFDFPEGWFNIRNAFATNELDLLLQAEKIYPWILEWMNKEEDSNNKRQFLCRAGLRLEGASVIQLRRKFKNKERIYEELLNDAFSSDVESLEATLEWIRQRFGIFELKSVQDVSLRKLLDYYWDTHRSIPEFVPILDLSDDTEEVKVQIKPADWTKLRYVASWSNDEVTLWRDIHDKVDYEFICIPDTYGVKFKEGLLSTRKVGEARITKSIDIPLSEPRLWEDKVYRTWKDKESIGLNIFLLNRSVPFLYRFVSGPDSFTVNLHENIKADRSQDDIYIYREFPEEDIFKVLIDHQDVLFKIDSDKLVGLLAEKLEASTSDDNLLTDDQKDKIRNDPESFQRIFDLPEEDIQILSTNTESVVSLIRDVSVEDLSRLVQETDENTRSQLLKNLDLIKMMSDLDVFEVLGRLLEKADKEQLEKLVEMWDEIEQDLERRKPNPRPVALIGFIGEKVIYWWLVQKTNNIEYKGLEYLPYDISVQYGEHPYYVEVKTTIQPDKESDDSIPFYLRKSQYNFIQNNPNSDFIVIKINLKDLGLDHLYHQYKTLGQDFNSIVEHYEIEIDEKVKLYINTPEGQARMKSSRMIFKMNIPRFDQEFWED